MRKPKDFATVNDAKIMLSMFRDRGLDTMEIALQFNLNEAVVYNALLAARFVETLDKR